MKKIYLVVAALLGFHLLILSQLQFTAWPEMVSFPYFINHGFVLYKDAIHAYPPLLVTCLALLYKVFGYKLIVLKLFGWTFILIGDVLIYLILKKVVNNSRLVIVGMFVYAILQPILEGNMVWPDLFLIPFLLSAFLILLKKKYFYAGLALGLALLTKQTAVFYIACSLSAIVYGRRRWQAGILYFLLGISVSLIPFLLILIKQNSLHDFLNWTIIYPSTFWTKFPGYINLSLSLRQSLSLLILFLPLVILVAKTLKSKNTKPEFYLLFSFLIAGIVGVYPRFSFFHLQPALAFFVLLVVYLFNKVKINPYYLLLVPVLILVLNFRSLQFGEAKFWTQTDIDLAKEIQSNTSIGKPIYLLGLNSNLYALADRLPNKPWLDNFGWYLEYPGVQERVISGLESNPPSTVFWRTPDNGTWYDLGAYQPKKITDWVVANYNIKGQIEKGIIEWSEK